MAVLPRKPQNNRRLRELQFAEQKPAKMIRRLLFGNKNEVSAMLKRTVTGALITAAVYLILYFSYIPEILLCATAVLNVLAVYEIYRASGICGKKFFCTLSMAVSAVVVFLDIPSFDKILNIVFPLAVATFTLSMLMYRHRRVLHPAAAVFFAALTVLLIRSVPELHRTANGVYNLGAAVTVCFASDIAAYLFGKAFGKHKMAPDISPNKTVEGSLAGILCAVLVLFLLGICLEQAGVLETDHGLLALYAVLAAAAGEFGDLAMSVIKRLCGVKDFGRLLPGHGGVLDRFDSHIFAIAFTLFFVNLTGGFIV